MNTLGSLNYLDDPSFWEDYNKWLSSPVVTEKDVELLNRIEANPPPKEPIELDPAIEPMVA